jgi:hypothetical protein
VTIHIKNQGDEAYKPHEYGSTIVITRIWSKDSSASWKIRSKDGKTISTKKDELAAICDHMNIQVDNPMNVLTQGISLARVTVFYSLRCLVQMLPGNSSVLPLLRKNTRLDLLILLYSIITTIV